MYRSPYRDHNIRFIGRNIPTIKVGNIPTERISDERAANATSCTYVESVAKSLQHQFLMWEKLDAKIAADEPYGFIVVNLHLAPI